MDKFQTDWLGSTKKFEMSEFILYFVNYEAFNALTLLHSMNSRIKEHFCGKIIYMTLQELNA